MHILLLGQGAREHAMAQSISKSKLCKKLFVAPGNAITTSIYHKIEAIDSPNNFTQIKNAIIDNSIDLVISGLEEPLVNGLYDELYNHPELKGVKIIGPCKKGALLEGSKVFSKDFMEKYNIPTAKYKSFTNQDTDSALKYIETINFPIVIKADGLASGKGVLICQNYQEAKEAVNDILNKNIFGASGSKIVIEEFLNGIEASIFLATDGQNYVLLPSAKDYKKIGLNDTGPNTGGMGAISTPPFIDDSLLEKIRTKIISPTINGLKKEGIDYKGFIFVGIMNVNNEPYVLEYNVRLGDPETECILPKIESDFLELLIKISDEKLDSYTIKISDLYSATIVLAKSKRIFEFFIWFLFLIV
ncbi:MAG: phosphoribosylamine--glycine ligase [Solitalea-like symbiont of Acarus siro]